MFAEANRKKPNKKPVMIALFAVRMQAVWSLVSSLPPSSRLQRCRARAGVEGVKTAAVGKPLSHALLGDEKFTGLCGNSVLKKTISIKVPSVCAAKWLECCKPRCFVGRVTQRPFAFLKSKHPLFLDYFWEAEGGGKVGG